MATFDEREFLETVIGQPAAIVVLRRESAMTKEDVRRLAIILGGVKSCRAFDEIRTIKHVPSAVRSTALGLGKHEFHTDGSFIPEPPSRFILSFRTSDPGGGGVSTFVPVSAILAEAPLDVVMALNEAEYRFARDDDGGFTDVFTGPILSRDVLGNVAFRWRCDDHVRPEVVRSNGTAGTEAVQWVQSFLEIIKPVEYAAQTGEAILIPNRLWLHGRTALSPDSPREVYRAWIP